MVYWFIVVFLLGFVGLLHEIFLIEYNIPVFAEATSVVIMLVAMGMAYAHHREIEELKKKEKE